MQKVHDDEKQAILDVRIVIGQGEPPKKQPESEEEQKRLEYTARQKVLYDYNTYMEENYDRGYDDGRAKRDSELIAKWRAKGMTDEEINALLN